MTTSSSPPEDPRRVVVSGASGFVGANVARRLLAHGHEVHLLLRPGFRTWRVDALRDRVHLESVDLAERERLARWLRDVRPHWVMHLAAHGAYPTQTDLPLMIRTNVEGTANLLFGALEAGCEAFVNSGSSSEYGVKGRPPREDALLEPNSDYAVTKASATLLCRSVARREGIHAPTLRLYSIYGPWEEPSRLWPTLIREALRGSLPELVQPDTARDFCWVEDAVDAYLLAARRGVEPDGIYNVGTGRQTTVGELVDLVRRRFELEVEPAWGRYPARSWDTSSWCADPSRLLSQGWGPPLTVPEGLERFVQWVEQNAEDHPCYVPARRDRGGAG